MPEIIAPDIRDDDLSAYVNEYEHDAEGKTIPTAAQGWRMTARCALARQQRWVEETKQYPPMEHLPAQYDAAITRTSVILCFGLGVTYDQLLRFVNKHNIRAPSAPDQPITRPVVAFFMIAKHLATKVRGLRLFYRRPRSLQYDMVLALYSNHSFRKYQYRPESEKRIIEIMKEELEIDSTPMWYWDMDRDTLF
ncbi:hypothetical protein HETIRDRAFT_455051 [Heterobasidion irregulare TC 32-1]|uniref:Uncharacterized protein n=1 Tax=Heterobasidion irregulare (strain TC 32-1) TaxID=747525 RepID=W4JUE4_HETIT|nr:uncharacterized protein HETIRDRAFT_455051 [Heterobasidion irregulare TC 32-1]ETW76501.1 hypothetical protein HETIRDRAFT_455051 [Heterobasidion irregulare TC 32-1]